MSYLESNLVKDSRQLSVDKLSKAFELTDSKETSKEEKKILKEVPLTEEEKKENAEAKYTITPEEYK